MRESGRKIQLWLFLCNVVNLHAMTPQIYDCHNVNAQKLRLRGIEKGSYFNILILIIVLIYIIYNNYSSIDITIGSLGISISILCGSLTGLRLCVCRCVYMRVSVCLQQWLKGNGSCEQINKQEVMAEGLHICFLS